MLFWSLVHGRDATSRFVSAAWTRDPMFAEDLAITTADGPANLEPTEGINVRVFVRQEPYVGVDAVRAAATPGSKPISPMLGSIEASLGSAPGYAAPR